LPKLNGTPEGEAKRSLTGRAGGEDGPGEPEEPILRRWRALRPRAESVAGVVGDSSAAVEAAAAVPSAC